MQEQPIKLFHYSEIKHPEYIGKHQCIIKSNQVGNNLAHQNTKKNTQ